LILIGRKVKNEKGSGGVKAWTCSQCGYIHMTEQAPISCIICNNDVFLTEPSEYYKKEEKHAENID
tara:strand:- start:3231 stop:3428 length:198 start_codon:yes stop_codon:yes gene_type:complete